MYNNGKGIFLKVGIFFIMLIFLKDFNLKVEARNGLLIEELVEQAKEYIRESGFNSGDNSKNDIGILGKPYISHPSSNIYISVLNNRHGMNTIFDGIGLKDTISSNLYTTYTIDGDIGYYPYYANRPDGSVREVEISWEEVGNGYPSNIINYSYTHLEKRITGKGFSYNNAIILDFETENVNDLKYSTTFKTRYNSGADNFSGRYEAGKIIIKDNLSNQYIVAMCNEMNEYEVSTSPVTAIYALDKTKTLVENDSLSIGIGRDGINSSPNKRVTFVIATGESEAEAIANGENALTNIDTYIETVKTNWEEYYNGIENEFRNLKPKEYSKVLLSLQQIRAMSRADGFVPAGTPNWNTNFIRNTSWMVYTLSNVEHEKVREMTRTYIEYFKEVNNFRNANSFKGDKTALENTMNQTDSSATFLMAVGELYKNTGYIPDSELLEIIEIAMEYVEDNYIEEDKHVRSNHPHDYWDDYAVEIDVSQIKYESMIDVLWIKALELMEPLYRELGEEGKGDWCREVSRNLREGLEDYRMADGGLYYGIKTDNSIYEEIVALPGNIYAAWLLNDSGAKEWILNQGEELKVEGSYIELPVSHSNVVGGARKNYVWMPHVLLANLITELSKNETMTEKTFSQFRFGGVGEYADIRSEDELSYRSGSPSFGWANALYVYLGYRLNNVYPYRVVITGEEEIEIDENTDIEKQYTGVVYSKIDDELEEEIEWSIKESVTGVEIDENGKLTIRTTATEQTITIVGKAVSNQEAIGEFEVVIVNNSTSNNNNNNNNNNSSNNWSNGNSTYSNEEKGQIIINGIKNNLVFKNNIIEVPIYNEELDEIVAILNKDLLQSIIDVDSMIVIALKDLEYIIPSSSISIDKIARDFRINKKTLDDLEIVITIKADKNKEIYNNAKSKGLEILANPITFNTIAYIYSQNKVKTEINLNAFDKYVTKRIKIPTNMDVSKVITGVLYENGKFIHVPTDIIKSNGEYYAIIKTLSNSTYVLVYNNFQINSVENHWAKKFVNDLARRLIIDRNREFKPDEPIIRGDFIDYMIKSMGIYKDNAAEKNVFTDVKLTDLYYNSVIIAYDNGIIVGYPDKTFKPKETITREEAMVIYSNVMDFFAKTRSEEIIAIDYSRISEFVDKDSTSDWAVDSVKKVVGGGIVNGRLDKTIASFDNLTYSEAATINYNILRKYNFITYD